MRYRLVATAGHVDHGKTALLEALTGQNADRLEEEQQRGLTVDLGFADMRDDDEGIHVGFVDVPGHQDFIKNMVSGMGSVQGVLFVVSAVDGWQAQSREHFEIVNLLEPSYCCFALTKTDLADEEMQLIVEAEIEEAMAGTDYAGAPRVPVSAETGEGVESLKRRLFRDLSATPDPPDHGKPYCPVDRSFSVQGQGTVVTGSLSGGSVEPEADLARMPDGEVGRVRSVQQYHEGVDRAEPGSRVALNVPDWDREQTHRGDVAAVPNAGRTGEVLDGRLRAPRDPRHPLEHDTQVLAYLGTGRYPARVLLADAEALPADSSQLARIKLLSDRVFTRPGDRLIVRSFNDRFLLGCLRVGAVDPGVRWGDVDHRSWLSGRFPVTPRNLLVSELRRRGALTLTEAADGTRYDSKTFRDAAESLGEARRLEGNWVVDPAWWEQCLDDVQKRVREYHRDHPTRPGLPRTSLRDTVGQGELRERFLEALGERGILARDEHLRDEDFEPHLDSDDRARADELLEALGEAGLEGPDRETLEDRYGSELVAYLVREGRLVELNEERLLTREVFRDLREALRAFLEDNEPVRLSEVRDHLGSTRKYVIPLMEYLDRQGMTYRDGEVRHLRRSEEVGEDDE